MRQLEFKEIERILAIPAVTELTVNDLRILVGALNALDYFGMEHGEDYIDEDGLALRDRLERNYTNLIKAEFC